MPASKTPKLRWLAASVMALQSVVLAPSSQGADRSAAASLDTASPIKHVIVIIGENRTFDHLFATYVPPSGDSIANLLSKGIVNADGSPGANFADAQQFQARPPFQTAYYISLTTAEKAAYQTLPPPGLNFAPNAQEDPSASTFIGDGVIPPFFSTITKSQLAALEPALKRRDLTLLTTGAALGLSENPNVLAQDVDTRIADFNALPNGPFPLEGSSLPYDSYTGDTTHRLFEMWQQSDCSVAAATPANPSGCLNDLYPFVITSYTGEADNGGSNSMAFYNVQTGDAPFLKRLADHFSISDNFHQSGMGGTAINHVYLGSGDDVFWSDGAGNPEVPPSHIADPDPQPGSDNVYKVDANFDGNFTNCSDQTQPGIPAITTYLAGLTYQPGTMCEADHFYMINNASPGFLPDGTLDTSAIAAGKRLPPSTVRTIGEALNDHDIPWAYYGGGYNAAVQLAKNSNSNDPTVQIGQAYCDICNFESYSKAIMGDVGQRSTHIKDVTDFFAAIEGHTLPAVSFVKPDSLLDGHPASSKVDLFEGMLADIIDRINGKHDLSSDTAVIITWDEGGGYYDSGYIQPLDFFGDGPRIPLIIVSHYTRGGHVNHSYGDHVSILKFIERNWGLRPLTTRSRDNLPNPIADSTNLYVPTNSPAIGDLFDMFDFGDAKGHEH
jgi:phospholipase C